MFLRLEEAAFSSQAFQAPIAASPVEDADPNDIEDLFNVNFFGPILLLQESIKIFREHGHGLIINISSMAGRFSLPFHGFYSATKFALEAVSESCFLELKDSGIKVVIIEPGDLDTNFTSSRKVIIKNDSPQQSKFLRALKITEKDETKGSHPRVVAKAIYKAINSYNPKLRYRIGKGMGAVNFLHRLIPDKPFLRLIGSHFKV